MLPAAVGAFAFYLVACLFLCRWHYQNGSNHLELKNFVAGEAAFTKGLEVVDGALAFLPKSAIANDRQRLHRSLGSLYFQNGSEARDLPTFLGTMSKAEHHYKTAAAINPFDVEAALGFSRTTAALEKVSSQGKSTKAYNSRPLFAKALQLRPNGLEIHYLLIRYLYDKKLFVEFNKTVASLIAIQPQVLESLKMETFFPLLSPSVIEESLKKAATNPITASAAHAALSAIEERKGNLDEALSHYQRYLDDNPRKSDAFAFAHIGRLHLMANRIARAFRAFTHAATLESNSEKIINHLWNIFRLEKKYSEFLQFCDQQLPETMSGGLRELVVAKALSELEQYTLALFNLEKIPQTSRYRAEGCYLAAGIFEKIKDWDQMELAAHQAIVLDSKNSAYHLRFSTALKQKKKLPQAEEAADRAIATSEKSQAWLHNHRAWIRWQRNNISGATKDWEEAIRLKPDDPAFYYLTALAHERLNDKASAIKSLQQALQLKPNDAKYLEKMAKLQNSERKP